jgi:hypothetical protein
MNIVKYMSVGFIIVWGVIIFTKVSAEPATCPSGSYEIDREKTGEPICKLDPTGCPYGDSIPLGPECDKHKNDQVNKSPVPPVALEPVPQTDYSDTSWGK